MATSISSAFPATSSLPSRRSKSPGIPLVQALRLRHLFGSPFSKASQAFNSAPDNTVAGQQENTIAVGDFVDALYQHVDSWNKAETERVKGLTGRVL